MYLSTNGMNHARLSLPSQNWYSFTDFGKMEGHAEMAWPGIEPATYSGGSRGVSRHPPFCVGALFEKNIF